MPDRAGQETVADAGGLCLLFSPGRRPDVESIRKRVDQLDNASISHDPAQQEKGESGDEAWLEAVVDGLTFDIFGLAPGAASQTPQFVAESGGLSEKSEAVVISPGPHLVGGDYLIPILRGLLTFASQLGAGLGGLLAYGWAPSVSVVSTSTFFAETDAWSKGGAFPARILIRFKDTIDQGLQSQGLSAFTGQEVRIEPDIAEHRDTAERLGMRLVSQLVLSGRVETVEEVTGPDGTLLRLEPSKNGNFVRVWRG